MINTANDVANALNKSASYCDDFYEYSCGGWIAKTSRPPHQPLWNYWQSISDKIHLKLIALMDGQFPDTDVGMRKAQLMFRTCLKMERNGKENARYLKELVERLGGWPLVGDSWNETAFEWEEEIINVIKNVGLYPILKIFPEVDYKDTTTTTLYVYTSSITISVLYCGFFCRYNMVTLIYH